MTDQPPPPSPDLRTDAIHAGRQFVRARGVHAPPIDLSTTYPFQDLDRASDRLERLADGGSADDEPIYARLHNPTVARSEDAIARLEGADHCIAFASGMAAITACLLGTRAQNDHVVAVRPCYGTTDHLLSSELLGLSVTWTSPEKIADACTEKTGLVLIESPTNPTLDIVDIEATVDRARGVPVLVDSTFAPPVLQRPLAHGATLSLHSATKFLGGHGDVVGGVVSTNDSEWARKLRRVRVMTGALLHPMAAYFIHRSIPTLPSRVERAQSSAAQLAQRIDNHSTVSAVHYPGHTDSSLLDSQMNGPGTMIAFDVGNRETARAVLQNTELITPAVSLGAVDSLIQHPASLTHGIVEAGARQSSGVTPGLLRLSVGLENTDDLWMDLSAALEAATTPAESTTQPLS